MAKQYDKTGLPTYIWAFGGDADICRWFWEEVAGAEIHPLKMRSVLDKVKIKLDARNDANAAEEGRKRAQLLANIPGRSKTNNIFFTGK